MTEQQIKDLLLSWIKDYCRDDFALGTPAGVTLFIEMAWKKINQNGIESEQLGDATFTYMATDEYIKMAYQYLHMYRRIKLI